MRIGLSGTHVVGKSTLADALGERLPRHAVVPEPYHLLEERGYEFEHPPSVEDYVAQLRQSLAVMRSPASNVIFDRTPLDFLGYICASPGSDRFDLERWRKPISAAMAGLDLVVLLPVDPAHEAAAMVDDAAFRLAVDGWLRDIVDGDEFDLCEGVDVLVLGGPWHGRVDTVLAHSARMRRERPSSARR